MNQIKLFKSICNSTKIDLKSSYYSSCTNQIANKFHIKNSLTYVNKKYYYNKHPELRITHRGLTHEVHREVIKQRKLDKLFWEFKDYQLENFPRVVKTMQRGYIREITRLLKDAYSREELNEKKLKLITLSTGVAKENLKSTKFVSLEKFKQIKKAILKAKPHLAEYDFEENLAKVTGTDERIEFIVDNLINNKDSDFIDYFEKEIFYPDGTTEVILVQRPGEIARQLKDEIEEIKKKRGEEIEKNSEVMKDGFEGLMDLSEMLDKTDPEIIPTKFNDDQCAYILRLNYMQVNIIEALEKKAFSDLEYKVGYIRANLKDKKLKKYNYDTPNDITLVDQYKLDRELHFGIEQLYEYTKKNYVISQAAEYMKSADNHRIDVGIVITRLPIFLTLDKKEVDFIKYKSDFEKKYEVNLDAMLRDFEVFVGDNVNKRIERGTKQGYVNEPDIRINKNKKRNTELSEEFTKNPIYNYDNDKTYSNYYYLKEHYQDDPYHMYASNSKYYMRVDPTIKNPKHIQTDSSWDIFMICKNKQTGLWEFPTTSLMNGGIFRDHIEFFARLLTKGRMSTFYPGLPAIFHINRDFYEHEKSDEKNKGLVGVRTYYFPMFHDTGIPFIYPSNLHNYEDFRLVRKNDMNKYLEKDYWGLTVPYLKN